ncbi:MAG TPA: HDOD domain-containing protein [Candidatus Hydrogenedentes bacterium]|nr:HDOD domain-containing protein [Candidatus Hydrogenedentota bacterium]HQM51055.1 HDOD domain-containing protein [Candidatus Hydrogenedentota bacterium]
MKLSSKDPSKKPIGELLVEAGLIRPEHIEEALQKQRREGGKMVEILIGLGRLQTNEFVRFLARQGGVPSIDLAHYEIPVQIIGLVQRDFVIKNEAIPIDKLGRLLTVAMVCPLDSDTIQELETMTQSKVKPLLCSPEAIRMAIQRYYPAPGMAGLFKRDATRPNVEGLEGALSLRNATRLVREIESLPALPDTVRRVRESAADATASVKEVGKIISTDPAVTAKILSVANSAAYGFCHRVDSVSHAVSLLGLRETYALVLSMAIADIMRGAKGFNYKRFWQNAVTCAAAARLLAEQHGRKDNNGVFSAGLLHNLGELALAHVAPGAYSQIPPNLYGQALIEAEQKAIGIAHPEAGYELALHWELPQHLAEPIRFHHAPEQATRYVDIVSLIAIAVLMVHASMSDESQDDSVFEGHKDVLARAGLELERAKAAYRAFLTKRGELSAEVFTA